MRDGVAYPSVTTILQNEPKPWMGPWTASLVAGAAWDTLTQWIDMDRGPAVALLRGSADTARDAAGEKGSEVHEWIAAHTAGVPLPELTTRFAESSLKRYLEYVDDYKPDIKLSECQVYNTDKKYAGTIDAFGLFNGVPTLVDYKTGKNVHGLTVAMQLIAYAKCNVLQQESGGIMPMPVIEEYRVVHLRPRSYKVYKVHADDPDVWKMFQALLYIHQQHPGNDQLLEGEFN